MARKKRISYYYDKDVGDFYYGQGHPMKPQRIRLCHGLIMHYGLYAHMNCYTPKLVDQARFAEFHEEEYVQFLRNVTPSSTEEHGLKRELGNFHMSSDDCPHFNGLFKYCQIVAGGSLGGAVQLNHGIADTVINWSGGLHHAKKGEASGFCYVNDIVLGILELLKYHQRVLYLDIDIHHGDGVEEAFLTCDRVCTVSFHKYGDDFFPGTGHLRSVGRGDGQYYSVNVPLDDGLDDEGFAFLFERIMPAIMWRFQPGALVVQCGADSLAGDRIGTWNLTLRGHARALEFMSRFDLPMLVLGGGGYNIRNTSRCWAYETAVLLNQEIPDELPDTYEYRPYFYRENYKLHIYTDKELFNKNTNDKLQQLVVLVLQNVSHIHPVGVGLHHVPQDGLAVEGFDTYLPPLEEGDRKRGEDEGDEEEVQHNVHLWNKEMDQRFCASAEFFEEEELTLNLRGQQERIQPLSRNAEVVKTWGMPNPNA